MKISSLVADLGSPDRQARSHARKRLIVLGGRAVGELVDVLDGGSDRERTGAIAVLSLIRDPRARESIAAQLHDRNWRLREAAARALARIPCRESVAELERCVRADGRIEVRTAALRSLISVFEAGFDEAAHEVLGILFDPAADGRLRRAGLMVLPLVPAKDRGPLLRTLRSDPDLGLARTARRLTRVPSGTDGRGATALKRALGLLASPDIDRWHEGLQRLSAHGSAVIEPLVDEMVRRRQDAEFAMRAAMVLRGLGARRLKPIAEVLENLEEPMPLEVLVDVIGSLDNKPLIYRLKDLIERLRSSTPPGRGAVTPDAYQRVISRAHYHIARIGSRVAVADLIEALSSPELPVDLDLLAAVELIGTRDELADLIRAYRKEDAWMRIRISDVFRGIMRRERLRRNSRIISAMSVKDRRWVEEILGPPSGRKRRKATRGSTSRRKRP